MRPGWEAVNALRQVATLAVLIGATIVRAGSPTWDLQDAKKLGDTTYRLGKVDSTFEISGIALSRTRGNVFWGIQDDGADLVFAFDAAGNLTQTVAISGLQSEDLEDIAADLEGNLYLADTGTNLRTRDEISVHRIREPKPGETNVQVERSWRLTWPERGRDCESMVVHAGYVWLVAKIREDGQQTTLARFAITNTEPVIELEVLGDLEVSSPAAAASLTPDGELFALSSRAGTYSWRVNGNVASAVRTAPLFSPSSPDTKKEGLTFVPQGLLVATESRELYLNIAPSVVPPAPNPSISFINQAAEASLHWSAPFGIPCLFQYRHELDRGDWETVAADFPGLGFPVKWNRDQPAAPSGNGFLRLTVAP